MKNVKFSLSNIEGKLSRVEMQQILGGCGGGNLACDTSENAKRDCPSGRKCIIDGSFYCCLRYQGDWQSCHK